MKSMGDALPTVHCAHTRLVNPQELKPHPDNPNQHPASQIKLLKTVIGLAGWRAPIRISKRSGLVTAGHGRLYAALSAGWATVPVDDQEYATEADEIADMLADNHTPELAALNKDQVRRLIEQKILPAKTFDSDATSFLKSEIDKMFEALKPKDIPDYPITARMNEKYDYVVIFTDNEMDFVYLKQLCGVQKERSYKNQYVGEGRAVPFSRLMETLKEKGML